MKFVYSRKDLKQLKNRIDGYILPKKLNKKKAIKGEFTYNHGLEDAKHLIKELLHRKLL